MPRLKRSYGWILLFTLFIFVSHTNAADHAIILQYHHVSDTTPKITSIAPEQFEWHLEYLQQQGFIIWPLSKIAQYLKQGKSLPDKCVAITFDDAYRSIYTTAFPLLKKRNWPFTLFLNTDAVGNSKNSLSWDEIRQMNRSVAEIGNHSHTHAHLIRYQANESPLQWRKRIIAEIQTAQQMIDQHLSATDKRPPRLFAYPYGEYSIALTQIIRELGYTAVGQHSGPAALMTPLEILPRFPMGGIYSNKSQLIEKLKTYPLPLEKKQWLRQLAKQYRISGSILEHNDLQQDLIKRVNGISPAMALAQAANESAWGTSRFSKLGNNLFGIWTYNEKIGIKPLKREPGKKHFVRKFSSFQESVIVYMHTLNTHAAYKKLRDIRHQAVFRGEKLSGYELARGLEKYSAKGQDYIKMIQKMINHYNLENMQPETIALSEMAFN